MSESYNLLKIDYLQQKDGLLNEDEERMLKSIANSYAIAEHSIAVLSNHRTDRSYIFYGGTSELLGLERSGASQIVDSIWEDMIYARIHPEDWKLRCLQELTFNRMVTMMHSEDAYNWCMENVMRMRDKSGKYHYVKHRIRYFRSSGKLGIGYALCLYNITDKPQPNAVIYNLLTGERRDFNVDDNKILSERERDVLRLISEGLSSKQISEKMNISKHTVDRHRQNIIAKLQVGNTTEACFKAKQFGLI